MENLQFVAQQLRKPAGDFAVKVAEKMSTGNRPLYDLTFKTMEVGERDHVLEIGFGGGGHFSELLTKANQTQVTGIDYSEEMVEMAKSKNENLIQSGRLTLHPGSSSNLLFKDNTFNTVFCNMVIYFWDEYKKHLSEIHRVLKPGGKFYTGMRTQSSMQQLPFTKYGFNLFEVETWKSILNSSGFEVIDESRNIDPPLEENGKQIQLESVCIVAIK